MAAAVRAQHGDAEVLGRHGARPRRAGRRQPVHAAAGLQPRPVGGGRHAAAAQAAGADVRVPLRALLRHLPTDDVRRLRAPHRAYRPGRQVLPHIALRLPRAPRRPAGGRLYRRPLPRLGGRRRAAGDSPLHELFVLRRAARRAVRRRHDVPQPRPAGGAARRHRGADRRRLLRSGGGAGTLGAAGGAARYSGRTGRGGGRPPAELGLVRGGGIEHRWKPSAPRPYTARYQMSRDGPARDIGALRPGRV